MDSSEVVEGTGIRTADGPGTESDNTCFASLRRARTGGSRFESSIAVSARTGDCDSVALWIEVAAKDDVGVFGFKTMSAIITTPEGTLLSLGDSVSSRGSAMDC